MASPDQRPASGATPDTAPGTFGAAMARLEAIVARLESDEAVELEDAIALYEEAVALARACRAQLARAQLRLTELAVEAHNGVDAPRPADPGTGGAQ
jgi:exodeoxyribonuclease VII small subunit